MQAILLKVLGVQDKDLAKKYTESLFDEKALIRSISDLRRASKDDLKECGLAISHVNLIADKFKELGDPVYNSMFGFSGKFNSYSFSL